MYGSGINMLSFGYTACDIAISSHPYTGGQRPTTKQQRQQQQQQ
jgi:hypothetical protein